MKIMIGSDHAAVALKTEIAKYVTSLGHSVYDLGVPVGTASSDYPDVADSVCQKVQQEKGSLGILICGTGIGMSIAANKHKGIRCALCSDSFSAKMAREHNDANVLALGERVVGVGLALQLVGDFLSSCFSEQERHIRRLKKLQDAK
ncbi:MAG: ribose 5-phosphate isomerase B [Firmicutes bacterium]|nr:ribose 5-phosphate isomerase B [Bacillota bacterium]